MIEDMQLAGLSKASRDVYLAGVKGLANYFGCSPAQLGEEQLRQYFLHLINDRKFADRTITCYLCAVKFLFEKTLSRTFPVFKLIRPKRRRPVPNTALLTIYSCGLRAAEVRFLRASDIDSERMLLFIRKSKGNKDRYVPLPKRTYEILRQYWCKHKPICKSSLHKTLKAALRQSSIVKAPV